MSTSTGLGTGPDMTTAVLDLCAIPAQDRATCARMLAADAAPGTRRAIEMLDARWADPQAPALKHLEGVSELQWIEAMLRFSPLAAERLEEAGVAPAVIEATFADLGKQMELHRRSAGGFGMQTWWWLLLHFSGMLFRLGRLQFHLRQDSANAPWVIDVHIPEDGPLDAHSVDASFAWAAGFFAEHFPEDRITHATCDSWLLDPYLANGLPGSNMAAFAARFTGVSLRDEPHDALYFTFRAAKGVDPATLPRETSLQRLVLDRIAAGGVWQVGKGRCSWPAPVH